jgi:hypothetical protein
LGRVKVEAGTGSATPTRRILPPTFGSAGTKPSKMKKATPRVKIETAAGTLHKSKSPKSPKSAKSSSSSTSPPSASPTSHVPIQELEMLSPTTVGLFTRNKNVIKVLESVACVSEGEGDEAKEWKAGSNGM